MAALAMLWSAVSVGAQQFGTAQEFACHLRQWLQDVAPAILTRSEKYDLGSPTASRLGSLQNVALAMADARHKGADAAEKLPEEGTQARRFGKTRSAQSTALLEDYVELIADLLSGAGEARPTDIARRLGVSHATAVKTISRLKRAGLATARPYRGVFLTEKGQALADRVRVRHRLVVDLLCALGVPTESAEADAEGIEHHVSEMTLKAFAQFLKSRG
jgi:DtxR family manganese transport transcriptional regulator